MQPIFRFSIALFAIALSITGYGQTLDPSRATDWTLAGFKGDREVDYTVINFQARGGQPDGTAANDAVYQAILDSLQGSPAVIYFPPGTYFFTGTLVLRSHLILRGASAEETTLLFDHGGTGHLIQAIGSVTNETANLTANPAKDDHTLSVDDASGFQAGDQIILIEEDDALITSDWARYSTGQIVTIESKDGATLTLRSPLRRGYDTALQARISRMAPIKGIGIEKLSIVRQDATASQTSNIMLENVSDSWISCVASYFSNFGHIELRRCANVDIEGCFMEDAFAYGSGGKGYGVVLHSTTGECLITKNRFNHLRHSMLLQSGANGNVLAYNYSRNPFWTDVLAPANSAGDLVLHGNYPYLNLFEGNDVAHMVIDDSHGPNGPFNTLFRNRAHLYGIFMSGVIPSPGQNLIGNEVTNLNPIMGFYLPAGSNRFEFGNNIRGQIKPAGTGPLPETSLYLDSAPSYYAENGTWPPIGIPNTLDEHTNEAHNHYDDGYLTSCAADIVLSSTEHAMPEWQAFPVPASDVVRISSGIGPETFESINLYNMAGNLVRTARQTVQLNVQGLSPGVYIVRARSYNGAEGVARILVR